MGGLVGGSTRDALLGRVSQRRRPPPGLGLEQSARDLWTQEGGAHGEALGRWTVTAAGANGANKYEVTTLRREERTRTEGGRTRW